MIITRLQLFMQQPRITTRFCLLGILATARCCFMMVEQPLSSIMRFYPYMHWLAVKLKIRHSVALQHACRLISVM